MQASSRPTQTSHTVAAPQDEPPEAPPPWQNTPRYKPFRCSAGSAEVLSTKSARKIRTEPADKKTAAAKLFPSVTFPAPAPMSESQGLRPRPESAWQVPIPHGTHRWMLPVHPCRSADQQTGPQTHRHQNRPQQRQPGQKVFLSGRRQKKQQRRRPLGRHMGAPVKRHTCERKVQNPVRCRTGFSCKSAAHFCLVSAMRDGCGPWHSRRCSAEEFTVFPPLKFSVRSVHGSARCAAVALSRLRSRGISVPPHNGAIWLLRCSGGRLASSRSAISRFSNSFKRRRRVCHILRNGSVFLCLAASTHRQ